RADVAIVGAGPSGLAACKAALEEGLKPVVLERQKAVGGLWTVEGKVWNSLRTNLSKYTVAFSDFPWPKDFSAVFPKATEVQRYLAGYAERHQLWPHVCSGCTVTSLEPVEGAWRLRVETEEGQEELLASFVIVATGIFSTPNMSLPGLETFPGPVLHSSSYRSPRCLPCGRLLVVGCAFSGADVAAELGAEPERRVTVAAGQTPLWFVPRYLNGKPSDLLFYSRAAHWRSKRHSEEERNHWRHRFLGSALGRLPPPLVTPQEGPEPPFLCISDDFVQAVKSGQVELRTLRVQEVRGRLVIFSDGSQEEFDQLLLATGYRLDLPFLPDKVRKFLQLETEDQLQPLILAHGVWHPKIPQMAFVGLYRGPFFAALELQGRWACGVFSGRLPQLSQEEMEEALQKQMEIRLHQPRPQFPHDYVAMTEQLASFVGVHPTEILEDASHPLHRSLVDGPFLPFHFRLKGFQAKPEIAAAAIAECLEAYPLDSANEALPKEKVVGIFKEDTEPLLTRTPGVAGTARKHHKPHQAVALEQDVLVEVLLMSRCDALLSTYSNVSVAAIYFSQPGYRFFLFGDTAPGDGCEVCGNMAQFCCSRCKVVFYCSTECQRRAWKKHKLRGRTARAR
ncbi:unnamed protein product, partial [Cladocopium goreaui]